MRLAEHPRLAVLDEDVDSSELFLPWLDTLTHTSFALENLLTTDLLPDLNVTWLVKEALEEVASRKPRGPWGDTHHLAPLHALRGPVFAAGEENFELTLSGDHHCVRSTSSLPGLTDVCIRASAARYAWDLGDRSSSQWIVPLGASGVLGDPHHHDQLPLWLRGELASIETDWDKLTAEDDTFEQVVDGFGTVHVVPVEPQRDLDLIHSWVSAERARFWGMADKSRDEVLGIYEFLDSLPTHHVYLVHLDDQPVALLQTYDPQADPVGEVYDVRAGDIGSHLLIAPGDWRRGFTEDLLGVLGSFLLNHLGHPRLVAEPDARNDKAVARLKRTGFTLGPQVAIAQHDGSTKQAQLGFMTREVFNRFMARE